MEAAVNLAGASPPRVRAIERITAEIDLPFGVALWVIGAHVLTLLSPLLLVWVAFTHPMFIAERAAHPWLIVVGAAVMMVGSALEIAQNTFDRWYLTADTGSALLPTLVDCAFYTTICIGLMLVGIAVDDTPLLIALMALATLGTPILYLLDIPHHGMSAVLGAIVTFVLYRHFGNPSVWLFVVIGSTNGYFFTLLLKTLSQSLHGFTAIVNGVGTAVVAWSIHQSALGAPSSWLSVGMTVAGMGVAMGAVYPLLSKLRATPRKG